MQDDTKIAGKKTVSDWKHLRSEIQTDPPDNEVWEKAYGFFYERLETRYFAPIQAIQSMQRDEGEGFAIMAIVCSLIEFLEATHKGTHYVHRNPNTNNYEYNNSKQYFIDFLSRAEVAARLPLTNPGGFYSEVRCGLLHEAMTKGDWVIKARSSNSVYKVEGLLHIIYRDNFTTALEDYLRDDYKNKLLNETDVQQAFIRKMNIVAGLPINQ
jgi:hypothetical protein